MPDADLFGGQEELRELTVKEAELLQHLHQLRREIAKHVKHTAKRDIMIGEKETEIYDLKKQNQVGATATAPQHEPVV